MATAEIKDAIPPKQTGHPTGFWFFFWGEFAERCSYYGMRAILALYMVERLGVDKGNAGTFMSLFIAECYFFPLIGGWIADNFLGKYWTIVLFSVPYVIAQLLVGVENKYLVFFTLLLLAMGSGVIKPNISTLMGMTYDQQRPGQEQLRSSAFSWFYMSINIGAFLSQVSMPWLRTNYGYQTAFFFPAGLMALALIIFAAGRRFYAQESITRKVVGDPNLPPPAAAKTLTGIPVNYVVMTEEAKAEDTRLRMQTLGRIGALFLLVMIFWAIFDQSASTWIFFANTYMDCTLFGVPTPPDAIQAFNPLFIVLLVPVSVALFKLFPLKATTKIGLGFALTSLSMVIMSLSGFMAGEAQNAAKLILPEGELILPAISTELKSISGTVSAGEMKIESNTWQYDELSKKQSISNGTIILKNGQTISIQGGHLASTSELGLLASGGVLESLLKTGEERSKILPEPTRATLEITEWVKPEERVTVWWQVFAYLILTVAEILVSITGLELAFVAAPASMKSFVTACWLAVVFLANLLINAPITQLYPLMAPGVYFAMLAVAVGLVIILYLPVAARFNYGMASEAK